MAVKKEKQPGIGTREPVNKEEQCQQQVKFTTQHVEVQHVEKNGTQCLKSGSQRQVGQQV